MSNTNQNRQSPASEARAQAKAYASIWAPRDLELDNGAGTVTVPPHPNLRLLDDDRLEAYEALLFEVESYDREDDVVHPEQRLENGVVIPQTTTKGAVKLPHRKTSIDEDGSEKTELIHPPWAVRVVIACLGPEEYDRLKAGGKSAADVWRIWNEQGVELAERERADTKSLRGFNRVADVSSPTGG